MAVNIRRADLDRGRELPSEGEAGGARQRRGWLVAGLTATFLGVLVVMLVSTGVFQAGIRPHLEPVFAKAKTAWGSIWAKPRAVEAKLPSNPSPAQTARPQASELGAAPVGREETVKTDAVGEKTGEPKQLVRVYAGMRPKDAAAIVSELDVPLAVEILSRMPDRQAARILGAMAPDRAARITSKLAERSL
jgi:hypothetical protein